MRCREACVVSRRAFLGNGAASLALWSLMPKMALAGTRDPRLLVVVLRGGLDGLAAVAPVGDPDYARLQGRHRAAHIRRRRRAAARRLLRAQRRDAAVARPVSERRGAYRSCRAHALSRALALRRAGCARKRPARRRQDRRRLAQSCACPSARRREGQSARPCPRRRGAARHARQGPGAVLDSESLRRAPARLHDCAAHGPLRRDRPGAGAGVCRGHGDPPRRRREPQRTGRATCASTNARRAAQSPVHRGRRSRSQVPVHRRRAAHRRAELRRLGHACQRGPGERSARASSWKPRRCHRRTEDRNGSSVARHRLPSSSPSSAAPRASTARKGPTTAWPRSRSWPAAP